MKRNEPIQVDQLIRNAIEESGNASIYNARHICLLWGDVVGPTINRYTTARWITRDELHVTIASGVMKSELAIMSENIIARLNELAGMTANPVVRRLIIH